MSSATFQVALEDDTVAQAVAASLAPEAKESPDGATTLIQVEGAVIHLEITGADLSTLRAAMNSALRLLDTAHRSASV